MKIEKFTGIEYGTGRPVEVGRIEEEDGCVTLALRYLDEQPRPWRPTWVGPVGHAVQVPEGWSLSDEMVAALALAG